MKKLKRRSKIDYLLEILPTSLSGEICRLAEGRREGLDGIREIRVRREGACSMLIGDESLSLFYSPDDSATEELVKRVLGGALYAHRDSIASGYVSLSGGIRVGLCGRASYEGGRIIGVSDMRSLVFRIPSGRCDFGEELCDIYLGGVGAGMLIYSPPGVGKTTALRSLASSLGSYPHSLRVAVVDERCEFSEEDYTDCEVDILKGYKRREGIEIATRTMSPDLIMIDEIGADEAEAMVGALRCGIPFIATAHASSFEEVTVKPSLKPVFACGAFSVLVGISKARGTYSLDVHRL